MTQATEDRLIRLDRMRYVKNTDSSRLCYLAILANVLYFVSIYKSDVASWYYQILVGGSIVYNLLFMLIVFLASEGVKNYQKKYSWLLFVIGALQVGRIFILPRMAHQAVVKIGGAEQIVMQDLFTFRQTGVDENGKIIGTFKPTGAMPTFFDTLKSRGISLDPRIFSP